VHRDFARHGEAKRPLPIQVVETTQGMHRGKHSKFQSSRRDSVSRAQVIPKVVRLTGEISKAVAFDTHKFSQFGRN